MKELVSIVIPAYNADKYIDFTIESVLAQTYQNWELIIVIDGATDATEETVKKYLSDTRIRSMYKANSGVSDTRNTGMALSKGKYIAFLDADDALSIDFIEARVSFLENNTGYGCCGSVITKIDENNNPIEEKTTQRAPGINAIEDILLYKHTISSAPSNYLFRKALLEKHGITYSKDLNSTADRFFLLQLLQYTRCKCLDTGPLIYRVHSNSMSTKMTQDLFFDNKLYFDKLCEAKLIPESISIECRLKHYYILAGMAKQTKQYKYFVLYLWKILLSDPKMLLDRLYR